MNKKDKIQEYNVYIIRKSNTKIPARILENITTKTLKIIFGNKEYSVDFEDNWFKTLRILDNKLNEEGYKILCNGTSKKVYATGFCLNMGDGNTSYHAKDSDVEVVNTFEYHDWNEYTTKEEQQISFFGKKITEND